jgi:hypothetical protein
MFSHANNESKDEPNRKNTRTGRAHSGGRVAHPSLTTNVGAPSLAQFHRGKGGRLRTFCFVFGRS